MKVSIRTLSFGLALFFPFVIGPCRPVLAGPYPGQLRDHGHTGPGDGGVLTAPSITSLTTSSATVTNLSVTTATIQNVNGTSISGYRNRVINGDVQVGHDADLGGINFGVSCNSDSLYYAALWVFHMPACSGYNFTVQQSSADAPSGFYTVYYATNTGTQAQSSGDQLTTAIRIPGRNIADFQWGTVSASTVTLSFWVKTSTSGTLSGSLQNNAANRSYPFTYSVTSTNTWTYVSLTVPGDTSGTWTKDGSIGIQIFFDMGSGSSNRGTAGSWSGSTFYGATGANQPLTTLSGFFKVTGVQVEIGSRATLFEHRPYGFEYSQTLPERSDTLSGFLTVYVSSAIQSKSVGTSAQYFDVASITLPSGDWDVSGICDYFLNGATMTRNGCGIGTVTGNNAGTMTSGDSFVEGPVPTSTFGSSFTIASFRFTATASNNTLYLKGLTNYTVATPQVYGRISARRAGF